MVKPCWVPLVFVLGLIVLYAAGFYAMSRQVRISGYRRGGTVNSSKPTAIMAFS
jgi:hypothetical protein